MILMIKTQVESSEIQRDSSGNLADKQQHVISPQKSTQITRDLVFYSSLISTN